MRGGKEVIINNYLFSRKKKKTDLKVFLKIKSKNPVETTKNQDTDREIQDWDSWFRVFSNSSYIQYYLAEHCLKVVSLLILKRNSFDVDNKKNTIKIIKQRSK